MNYAQKKGDLEISKSGGIVFRDEKISAKEFARLGSSYNDIEKIRASEFSCFPLVVDYLQEVVDTNTKKAYLPFESSVNSMGWGDMIHMGEMYNLTTHPLSSFENGITLDNIIHNEEGIDKEKIILNMIKAVGMMHYIGVMHRDLRPANIMVQDNGEVKIVDFGIAQFFSPSDRVAEAAGLEERRIPPNTRSKDFISKNWRTAQTFRLPKNYEKVSQNSEDIYALGLVSALFLTGTHPFMIECPDYKAFRQMSREKRAEVKRDFAKRVVCASDRKLERNYENYLSKFDSELMQKVSGMFHPVNSKRTNRMSLVAKSLGISYPEFPPYFEYMELSTRFGTGTTKFETDFMKRIPASREGVNMDNIFEEIMSEFFLDCSRGAL